jgi:hypothetical protein
MKLLATILMATFFAAQVSASVPALFSATALELKSALAKADDFRRLGGSSCDVVNQDGIKDYHFCRASGGKYRCFADVQYQNGSQMRVWGSGCYERFSDCWWNGGGAVNPCH